MKLALFLLLGFLLMNAAAFAELSGEDLGKIEAMFEKYDARMREFVTMKIAEEIGKSEKQTREFVAEEIAESEKRIREHVSQENATLPIRMECIGETIRRHNHEQHDQMARIPH